LPYTGRHRQGAPADYTAEYRERAACHGRRFQYQRGLDRVEHHRLPAGAITVTYDIQSVSRNASKQQ
jgi:hypothetical protein